MYLACGTKEEGTTTMALRALCHTSVRVSVRKSGGHALVEELRKGAEWRANKLTASEYDETTWSARTWMAFTTQRLSVAVQYSAAQEVAEALGLSVAADPRAAP